jgi:hypothetical protein
MGGSPGPNDGPDFHDSGGNRTQPESDSDVHEDPEILDGSGDDIYGARPDLVQLQRTPATPNRRRSKRARTNKRFGVEEDDCAESDCEDPSSQEQKVTCAGPGCHAMVCHSLTVFIHKLSRNHKYHLSCVGLDIVPTGGWFCDTDCRKNAGQRVAPVRKRRRIVVSD